MRLGKAPFASQVRERAVQLYWSDPSSSCASVALEVGCAEETVRRWVHQAGQPLAVLDAVSRDCLGPFEELQRRVVRVEADLNDLRRRIEQPAGFASD